VPFGVVAEGIRTKTDVGCRKQSLGTTLQAPYRLDSNLSSLRSGQEVKPRLADGAAAAWCLARQSARAGRSLRWCSRHRLHLLRRSVFVLSRPVILLVGGFLDSVKLALLDIEGRCVTLADHADGTSGNRT
jgi:hypothetical protein